MRGELAANPASSEPLVRRCVPPGEYGVLAWSDSRSKAYLDPVFLKAVENQATKVVVQRGFTNTINVRAIAP